MILGHVGRKNKGPLRCIGSLGAHPPRECPRLPRIHRPRPPPPPARRMVSGVCRLLSRRGMRGYTRPSYRDVVCAPVRLVTRFAAREATRITVDFPTRPDNFTRIWINQHGTNARTEQHYVNGIANGPYRLILENGVVHREGHKKDGLWHGPLIVRNLRGVVLDTSEFTDGTGVYRIFNSDDQMTDEVPLLHGKPHGTVRCWRLGKLVTTRYYEHGVCNAAEAE